MLKLKCKLSKEYPNYWIYSDGRVKDAISDKFLNPVISKGYLSYNLKIDGFFKLYAAHRIVATVFIDNPNRYPVINHKNEVKWDNRVENLEWCTQEYNCNYSIKRRKPRVRDFNLIKDDITREKISKEIQHEVLELLKNTNLSYRKIAKKISSKINVKFTHSKVGELNKYFNIRKN